MLSLEVPSALGVDDFAFRRGKNYDTLIIDLKTHRPIDLLPDRSGTSLKAWLLAHPGVKIISRDRSTEYTRGATEGAPKAIQVADRWHVIKNLQEVLERIIHRLHAKLVALQKAAQTQQGSGRTNTDGGVAVEAERQRTRQRVIDAKVARFRRQQRYQEVVELYQAGHNILQIAQELGLSRSTVRNFVYAGAFPERATILLCVLKVC